MSFGLDRAQRAIETCPGCGLEVPAWNVAGQVAHMQAAHPEIIEQRLAAAGFVEDERGEWTDTLAAEDQ